jgi:rare lipoprotein A
MNKDKFFSLSPLMASFCLIISLALGGCVSLKDTDDIPEGKTKTVDRFAKKAYNKPYEINGTTYYPQSYYEYSEVGLASFYGGGDSFHGKKTSMGEVFSMHDLSAAHKTLPIPCVVRVTNLENGRSLKVKINDRGPFVEGRIIDVSRKTAALLGFQNKGIAQVRVEVCLNDTMALANTIDDPYAKKTYAKGKGKSDRVMLASLSGTASQTGKGKMKGKLNTGPKKTKGDHAFQKTMMAKNENIVGKPLTKVAQASKETSASPLMNVKSNNVFIQAGTFQKLAHAQTAAARVKGLDPRVSVKLQQSSAKQAPKFRLLVGPFKNSDKAKVLLKKISQVSAAQPVMIVE